MGLRKRAFFCVRRYLVFFIIGLICIFGNLISSVPIFAQIVAVQILDGASSVNVSSEEILKIADMKTGKVSALPTGNSYPALPASGGIKIREMSFSSMIRIMGGPKLIRINGRSYRGSVILSNDKGRIGAVNELGVEDYLLGVLPREVSPKWDREALKAQAVVSRTYILRNLGRFADKGYDLTSCDKSQVYGGADSEKPETTFAVFETKGQVLEYRGALASVYFHADSDGYTEDPKYVWGTDSTPEYLKGRREPVREKTPYSFWEYRISYEALAKILGGKGETVRKVECKKKNSSGRVVSFVVRTARGKMEIDSNKFRTILGAGHLKSTKIKRIINGRKDVAFEGGGWGHGVGLSQWGAKELADKGWNYKRILNFYFPGTNISQFRD
ncbi:MAG: hypothetical protein COT16_00230 [Elusimicrobia bacterium CG08_land_8_20_14_0_20_44_26]|nr:MAG: hypothetical protein COT16_00230 [Elusimicrobia bacterium CG08_land_8_20_14_0_20_44_26]